MLKGTVVLFDHDRGFGFVRPDSGDADVFVHIRDAARCGVDRLAVGDRLEFLTEHGRDGRLRAADIRAAG